MQALPQTDSELRELRDPLVMYFTGRRLFPAEDLADEVIFRIITKIHEGEEIENLRKYAFGVARLLMLEYFKDPKNKGVSIDGAGGIDSGRDGDDAPARVPEPLIERPEFDDETVYQTCLGSCLDKLKPAKRSMLLDYYEIREFDETHIKQREELAAQYNMSLGTLYTNISRLRKQVGDCSQECAAKKLAG